MLKWHQIAETNMIMITGVKKISALCIASVAIFSTFLMSPLTGKRRIKGNCAGK